jgi:hypothetical protein
MARSRRAALGEGASNSQQAAQLRRRNARATASVEEAGVADGGYRWRGEGVPLVLVGAQDLLRSSAASTAALISHDGPKGKRGRQRSFARIRDGVLLQVREEVGVRDVAYC